jgi:hypothetical protein
VYVHVYMHACMNIYVWMSNANFTESSSRNHFLKNPMHWMSGYRKWKAEICWKVISLWIVDKNTLKCKIEWGS